SANTNASHRYCLPPTAYCLLGNRECKEERAALAHLAFDPDLPTMCLHHQLAEGQAQARATAPLAHLAELGEDLLLILRRDPDSTVDHGHHHPSTWRGGERVRG